MTLIRSLFFGIQNRNIFLNNIMEIDNLEYKLLVAHMEITHRKPSHSFFEKATGPKRHSLQER